MSRANGLGNISKCVCETELMHRQMILVSPIILTFSSVVHCNESVLAAEAQPAFCQPVQTMVISQMGMAYQMALAVALKH